MSCSRVFPAVLAGLAPLALAACITYPSLVKISDVLPAPSAGQVRETAFPIVIERFSDERPNRHILGYKSVVTGATLTADGDISAALEKLVTRIFETKGMPRGSSPIMLRGTIQHLNVGTVPLASAIRAEVTLQLTLVNTATRAQLWQRSYGGTSSTGDHTAALSDAFRQMTSALERDDSMLAAKQFFGSGPAATVKAAPRPAAVEPRAPAEVTSDVDETPRKSAVRADDFALVIGIEKYQSVPSALYGERDAAAFRNYALGALGVPEENVIYLIGPRATRTGIAKYIEEWLPKNVDEKSRVYVYYSGHGAPDPVKGHAYLIPWDGDPSFLESTAYPVSKLYENLQKLKAKQVLVALDSCFSGAGGRSVLAKGARPLVTVADTALPPDPKLSVLTASSGEEIAGSLDEQGHGIFTYYLLKGLKGEAAGADGHVTLSSLQSYISQSVKRAARRQNREQTPQLKAADGSLRIH